MEARSETVWRTGTATIAGSRIVYREAGAGSTVLCLHRGDAVPRAIRLMAARRRVVSLALPRGVAADEVLSVLGLERCDVLAIGPEAPCALRLKAAAPEQIGAVVLLAPTLLAADGDPADPADRDILGIIGEATRPCLALFGTRDEIVPVVCARHYRERMPDCNLVFVYDAGQAMAEERPEAVASIVLDFLERHNLFLVRRESDLIFP